MILESRDQRSERLKIITIARTRTHKYPLLLHNSSLSSINKHQQYLKLKCSKPFVYVLFALTALPVTGGVTNFLFRHFLFWFLLQLYRKSRLLPTSFHFYNLHQFPMGPVTNPLNSNISYWSSIVHTCLDLHFVFLWENHKSHYCT